ARLWPAPRRAPTACFPPAAAPPQPGWGGGGGGGKACSAAPSTRVRRLARWWQTPSGRLACLAVRARRPDDRLSVGDPPRSPAPSTVYAPGVRHAIFQSPPIERTVPSQDHPAAQRRLSPTWLTPPQPSRPRLILLRRSVRYAARRVDALDRRGRCCFRVPPGRRADAQAPVLLGRSGGQLAVLDVAPQSDQQLAGQGHDAHLPRPLI